MVNLCVNYLALLVDGGEYLALLMIVFGKQGFCLFGDDVVGELCGGGSDVFEVLFGLFAEGGEGGGGVGCEIVEYLAVGGRGLFFRG